MNRATLQRTIFTDAHNGEQTYGFRFYDDYGQTYCNVMLKSHLMLKDECFLRKTTGLFDDMARSIFENALDNYGIYIDDHWYRFVHLPKDKWKLVG